jgi:hypothetical protein
LADIYGKKVFILYPPSVVQEEMIHLLIASEYEVALLKDKEHAVRAISKFPNSILFINIDERPAENQWEHFIRKILEGGKTGDVRVGILSYNDDPALKEKYLMDIGVPCGFVTLKLGLKESFKIIAKTLEANEAKGRRKFVRAACRPQDKASFNVKYEGDYLTGEIIDISSVGMACTFNKPQQLKAGTELDDIQLKLRAVLCRIGGTLVGINRDEGNTHVILFTKKISPRERHKIHTFVYDRLQELIDEI